MKSVPFEDGRVRVLQLTTRSMNSSSQEELENRLHSLTESLIQKQTMLEALSTEKNSLVLQLERLEVRYVECAATPLLCLPTIIIHWSTLAQR